MAIEQEVEKYYAEIAELYDEDRFSNTYGRYIHQQEQEILTAYISPKDIKSTLNLGCGTGRFVEFSGVCTDVNEKMLSVAKKKFHNTTFIQADARNLPFEHNEFRNIFCWHVFMHLNKNMVKEIFQETSRCLRVGGLFIFDIPSAHRRQLIKRSKSGWHGDNEYFIEEVINDLGDNWQIIEIRGILFFPIHRVPNWLRSFLIKIDTLLCRSFLKKYASYLTFIVQKN